MKLLVTDNLVSDLNQLDSFNISLEKLSIKDIPNQAQSLFVSDKYKFIFDEFITVTSFDLIFPISAIFPLLINKSALIIFPVCTSR